MDLFSYPVSLVMKFWHWALSFVVDPDSGVAWVGWVVLIGYLAKLSGDGSGRRQRQGAAPE